MSLSLRNTRLRRTAITTGSRSSVSTAMPSLRRNAFAIISRASIRISPATARPPYRLVAAKAPTACGATPDPYRLAKRGGGRGMKTLLRLWSVSALAGAALLCGCAGPMTPEQAAVSGMPQYCSMNNTATGALVGSALGAAVGGALGGWQGAAIGAGSGLALGGLTGAQADENCRQ